MDSFKEVPNSLLETAGFSTNLNERFLLKLMTSLLVICGNFNYTNLSCYNELCERTCRRHFNQELGLEAVNQLLTEQNRAADKTQLEVVDCTFVEKSGKQTPFQKWQKLKLLRV